MHAAVRGLQSLSARSNFPKSSRVLTRNDYLSFFTGSKRFIAGPCLVFRKENENGVCRLGTTIKTKEGSVVRNRVKRQIRESFRFARGTLPPNDYNVVISNIKTIDQAMVKKIRLAIDQFWKNEAKLESTRTTELKTIEKSIEQPAKRIVKKASSD